jgi:hypothetical protein
MALPIGVKPLGGTVAAAPAELVQVADHIANAVVLGNRMKTRPTN